MAIIEFHTVSKGYYLSHARRPRAFRDIFIRRRPMQSPASQQSGVLWALRDVSFQVAPGEAVGLIGPNGAGKSTALKLVSRIIAPTEGKVTIAGRVAALLELGAGFHPELTGRENVYLSGALIGIGRAEMKRKFDAILDFSEIEAFIDEPVKHYSSGMFARLAFAVSIHLDPEVLVVDEVLAVGDQAFQQKCLDRIADMRRQGVTLCLVSHGLETVRAICNRAIWFDHGRLRADGVAESVARQYLDATRAVEGQRLAREAEVTQAAQRWGEGTIQIRAVRLTGLDGQEQTLFQTGDPLVIHLDYQANAAVDGPVFGLAIHRQDGVHVCGPNTAFAGLDLGRVHGAGSVSYTIPSLPLLEGLYQVSAAVVNRDDSAVFDYHDRLFSFRVVNDAQAVRERYGLLTLRGEWDARRG